MEPLKQVGSAGPAVFGGGVVLTLQGGPEAAKQRRAEYRSVEADEIPCLGDVRRTAHHDRGDGRVWLRSHGVTDLC